MSIPCRIEFEDGSIPQRMPHRFACVPRIGNHVSLDWDGDTYAVFSVTAILHIPEGTQLDDDAFTVLRVKAAHW